jgi:hypothetical protein
MHGCHAREVAPELRHGRQVTAVPWRQTQGPDVEGLGSGYAHGCAPTAIPDVQRHALTGRGVERDADPAACCTHVHDQVQVLDTVMVGKRQWPPSAHPSQGRLSVDAKGVMRQAWHNRLFVQAFPGARPMQYPWKKLLHTHVLTSLTGCV